jgi:GNAT superfamily N-acetyltransferase
MDGEGAIRITDFRPEMQDAFRSLILAGMSDRWGSVDGSLNADLNDIGAHYDQDVVLVALRGEEVVGTGILVCRPAEAEIVRMSVDREHRRRGIGASLVSALLERARVLGVEHVVVETNAKWTDARVMYERAGFTLTHVAPGDFGPEAFFGLGLQPQAAHSASPEAAE